jgi:hypothetical protein
MFEKQETYTPAEAKRANSKLDELVAARKMTPSQAGAHRRHISRRTRIALKPSYTPQAARRAKAEITTLTDLGAITARSSAAYRAHITKRTHAG